MESNLQVDYSLNQDVWDWLTKDDIIIIIIILNWTLL